MLGRLGALTDLADGGTCPGPGDEGADTGRREGTPGVLADVPGAGERERVDDLVHALLGDERDDLVDRVGRIGGERLEVGQTEHPRQGVGHPGCGDVRVGVGGVQAAARAHQAMDDATLEGRRRDAVDRPHQTADDGSAAGRRARSRPRRRRPRPGRRPAGRAGRGGGVAADQSDGVPSRAHAGSYICSRTLTTWARVGVLSLVTMPTIVATVPPDDGNVNCSLCLDYRERPSRQPRVSALLPSGLSPSRNRCRLPPRAAAWHHRRRPSPRWPPRRCCRRRSSPGPTCRARCGGWRSDRGRVAPVPWGVEAAWRRARGLRSLARRPRALPPFVGTRATRSRSPVTSPPGIAARPSSAQTYRVARKVHVRTAGASSAVLLGAMRAAPGAADRVGRADVVHARDRAGRALDELHESGLTVIEPVLDAEAIARVRAFAERGPGRMRLADGRVIDGTYADRPPDAVSIHLPGTFGVGHRGASVSDGLLGSPRAGAGALRSRPGRPHAHLVLVVRNGDRSRTVDRSAARRVPSTWTTTGSRRSGCTCT